MSLDHVVIEARAFIAEHLSALDASTIAWLDQASTALAHDSSMSVLIEAWHQQADPHDVDEREERFLARLSTAMAIVAQARAQRLG